MYAHTTIKTDLTYNSQCTLSRQKIYSDKLVDVHESVMGKIMIKNR